MRQDQDLFTMKENESTAVAPDNAGQDKTAPEQASGEAVEQEGMTSQHSSDDLPETGESGAPAEVTAETDEGAEPVADESEVERMAEEPAPSSSQQSPGALLRAAREQAGMSVEELVAETKLSHANIQALENDEFSNLPKPVYVKGYYRKCAQVLKADEAAISAAYAAAAGTEPQPEPVAFTLPPSASADFGTVRKGSGWFGSAAFILLLGSVVGGLAFWYLSSSNGDTAAEGGDDSVMEMPLDPYGAESDSSDAAVLTELLAEPETPAAAESAPAEEEAAEPEPVETAESTEAAEAEQEEPVQTAAAAPAPVTGTGDLQLKFNQACWTDIRDASGERLLFGLIEAGEAHRIGGDHPYRILLGNPEGVEMTFSGENIDLEPHTRANKTAVFSLGG